MAAWGHKALCTTAQIHFKQSEIITSTKRIEIMKVQQNLGKRNTPKMSFTPIPTFLSLIFKIRVHGGATYTRLRVSAGPGCKLEHSGVILGVKEDN